MLNKFFIILLLSATTLVYSQSTGYMGKRVLIGYGFHTSPAFFGANAKNETIIGGNGGSAESGSLAFNAIHEGYMEIAASSKWMICLSARYYKTAYDNVRDISNINYNSNYSVYTDRPNGYYNIRGLTYTMYFKYYGKRYVAPWGRYVMFGPTLNTEKTTYDPAVMNLKARTGSYPYKDTLISQFGPKEQSFMGINLMLGFGRSRIIGNRITIDYGCNLQLFSVLAGISDVIFDTDVYSKTALTSSNYIENTVKKRVRGVNRFNVFLKVGVLLF